MDKKKKRDNDFYKEFKSINKNKLIDLVKKKLPQIKRDSIHDITQLFLDTMQEDLLDSKNIEIGNFIKFSLHRMPEKLGRNYYTGEIITTKPFNVIKVSLNNRLSKKLMKHFDVDLFFQDEKEK